MLRKLKQEEEEDEDEDQASDSAKATKGPAVDGETLIQEALKVQLYISLYTEARISNIQHLHCYMLNLHVHIVWRPSEFSIHDLFFRISTSVCVYYYFFYSFKGNVDPNSEVVNLVESMLVDENFKHNQQASLFISIYYTLLGFREGIEKNWFKVDKFEKLLKQLYVVRPPRK